MKVNFVSKIKMIRTPKMRFFFFIIADIILISLTVYLSFALRLDFDIPIHYLQEIPKYMAITVITLLPIFYYKRLYHFTWIYISISDLINIFKAVTYGFLFLGLLSFLARDHYLARILPRSVILIDYFLVFILIGGLRISKRLYIELFKKGFQKTNKPKLIIIGAGDAAEQLIRSIKQTPDYPFQLAGILDDSALKQKTSIHNLKVFGRIKKLPQIKKFNDIRGIIIAIPSATPQKIQHIINLAQSCGISYIKTIPSITAFIDDRVSIKDVRDIDLEDLLGRKKIDISYSQIQKLIQNKIVLITGAAGSIGFELVKQISKLKPKKIIGLDMDETGIFRVDNYLKNLTIPIPYQAIVINILNKKKLLDIFSIHRPDIVFHAAAYKHVSLMEQYPEEAVLNNILGTWNLAQASHEQAVKKFILISTDKAVNPTSVMGMTKRLAEILITYYNKNTQFIAVRFGNVLGSRGSVVPLFKQQIMSGGPVTVTHPEMKRYFMIPSEAILLVLQAAYLGQGGELFVLDMGEPVKILDLAKTMIKLAGLEPNKDIPIVFTQQAPGEKLFEEILTDKENMDSTKSKEIFIAQQTNNFNKDTFFKKIENLISLAKTGKNQEIKEELKKILL